MEVMLMLTSALLNLISHCCSLYLGLYGGFQTAGLTAQRNIPHILPRQIFTPATKTPSCFSPFWCNTKGFCQPKILDSQQREPERGREDLGHPLGCRLDSLSCKPMTPERSTEHKPCAWLSPPGSALFSQGNSAPCERSHYSHLGLFWPRKPHVLRQVSSIAHSCCLLSVFLPVETSVFC